MLIDPGSQPEFFRGATAWERRGSWWQPWRLPPQASELAIDAELASRAAMPAGVRVALRSDARHASLDVDVWGEGSAHLDVVIDGQRRSTTPLPPGTTTVEVDLDPGAETTFWLPQSAETRIGPLRLDGATAASPIAAGPRWATYGSSITHSRGPIPPSEVWPSLISRRLGWDVANVGLGANCLLDRCVVEALRVHRPQLVSMCIGINIYANSGFNRRTLGSQLISFLEAAARACPEATFVLVTPIASPEREDRLNAVGMTLDDLRLLVDAVYRRFVDGRARGDVVVSGLSLIGLDDAHLLDDGLHPGEGGHRLIAERFAPVLADAMTGAA